MPTSTSQKRRLELSHATNQVFDAILHGDTTSGILQALVDIAGPALRVDRALIYDVQFPAQVAVGLCEWLKPGSDITSTEAVYPLRQFALSAQEIAKTGAPLESSRDAVHPLLVQDGADDLLHGQMSIQRLLWYPFRQHADGCYVLVLNQVHENREWTVEELDFVRVVAAQVSVATMKLELLREQQRTEAELRQSEARYRLLYDNTPSMFFTVDGEGVVRNANLFAIEVLGYSRDELLGANVLQVVHQQDRDAVSRHLAACFADPGTTRSLSFRKIRRDGSTIWVKEATRVVEGPDGASALILCEDVTESRAHEEAARSAESRLHIKDEFMAMLSHELRNPLSPIVTALDTLRRRGFSDPELELIRRQVSHLRRLVDDLLDVSRITRGKVELRRERVELAVVAAQAIEVARPLFEGKGQHLAVDIPPHGLALDADPSRLVQAFVNLLSNASKYSEEGTEIRFSAERQQERLVVLVRDQGEGIEPEMLDRVFDLFVQRPQPSDRAQSGLGLGLTIVRNLITLHGGTVRARSAGRGTGTTVVVELPAAADDLPATTAPAALAPPDRVPSADADAPILVVEDNEDARVSMCRLLRVLGYRVSSAGDGPSALVSAQLLRPRVVLVDIGLPGMDGYALARELRRAHPTGLRLVAVTGYGQQSDHARSREAGFDAHLVKPVDVEALLPHLDAAPS